MALGKRSREEQKELWISWEELARAPGHPFYAKLNELLAEAEFDRYVEELCRAYYAERLGRKSIPPGVYFRMLLVGYFEGLDSQRAIAWRCADSFSLKSFLGYSLTERTPDHSSLTRIRQRLPESVHEAVFTKVLSMAESRGMLNGRTVAIDATTLEANAAMKSIVRRDTGESWKDYLRRLAQEAGIEAPTDEEARRLDRKRKKKTSNKDWESTTDPDSRIARMKDGRTHLAYKAEQAIDLESELIVGATIQPGDRGDPESVGETVVTAQTNLELAGSDTVIAELIADKGYHDTEMLAELREWGIRTYIPAPQRPGKRRWTDKPAAWQQAVYENRRRCRGKRSKELQRRRSERMERSFAHVCETGGARRTWLRGFQNVKKRYLMAATAHNLGRMMRALFGVGKPRTLQSNRGALSGRLYADCVALMRHFRVFRWFSACFHRFQFFFRNFHSRLETAFSA
jgi:transposase